MAEVAHLPCYSINSIRSAFLLHRLHIPPLCRINGREVSEQRKITMSTCKPDTGSSTEAIDSNERLMKGGLRRWPLLMTLARRDELGVDGRGSFAFEP